MKLWILIIWMTHGDALTTVSPYLTIDECRAAGRDWEHYTSGGYICLPGPEVPK